MKPLEWIIQGGPIMYPLLGCSLVSLTITIERLLYWWRQRRSRDDALVEELCELVAGGRHDAARALSERSHDAAARVFRAALTHEHAPLESALQLAAAEEIRGMKRFLRGLDTIITLAPLLGILGTVMGIIVSFDVISGGLVDDPIAVTGGIAQALLTTAVGLVVAVLSLIPYNYFVARTEDAIGRLESQLTSLEVAGKKGGAGP